MRNAVRIAVWCAAIVVLLAGGAFLYFSTGPGERFLSGLIARELGALLSAGVSIERFETNVFSRIEIEGVVIEAAEDGPPTGDTVTTAERTSPESASGSGTSSDPSAPSKRPPPIDRLRVDRLRVDYSLFTVLFGGLEVDSLFIDGAEIAIRSDSLPAPEIPPDSTPDTSRSPLVDAEGRFVPPVRIGYADLSNVKFLYDDRSVPIAVSASGIDIIAGMDEGLGGDFRLAVDSARLEYFDSPVSVTDLLVRGSINSGATGTNVTPLAIDTLSVKIAEMSLDGRLDAGADSIAGVIAISGDPGRVLAAISKGLEKEIGGGPMSARVGFTIVDPLGSPGVTWSIDVPSTRVSGVPVTNLRCDGGLRSDTLRVATISFGLYGGGVSGSGWMALDSLLPHRFSIAMKGVRASEYWKPRTKTGQFTRIPVTVDARIETKGDLSSVVDLEAKGNLMIASRASLVSAPAVTYSRRHLTLRSERGMAEITAGFDIREGRRGLEYDGTVDLAVASLEPLSSVLGVPALGGSLGVHAQLSGEGSDIAIGATVSGEAISYEGVTVVDTLFASGRIEDDEVFIDDCLARGEGIDAGALVRRLDKAVDAQGPAPDTTRSTVDAMGPATDAAGPAPGAFAGTLSYTLNAHGSIGNPSAELSARIDSPSVDALAFNRVELSADLSDNLLTVSRIVLSRDSSVTSVAGIIDLRDTAGHITGGLTLGFNPSSGDPADSNPADSNPPNTNPADAIPSDSIRLSFTYAGPDTFSISAETRHFAIAGIREFVPSLPFNGGQLDLTADVRREGDRLDADVPFALTQLALGRGTVDSIAGTITFADGTMSVDSLVLADDGRRFFVSAGVDLRKSTGGDHAFDRECATRGRISGDTADLAALSLFLPHPVEVGGSLDVELGWNGTVRRPKLRGSLDFRNVRYGPAPRSAWFTDLKGTIRIGDGAIRSDSITMTVGKAPILVTADFDGGDTANISASLDVSTSGNMLLTARAGFTGDSLDVVVESRDLDLAVAQPFVETLKKLKGRLTTRLTVTGPTADPVVDGALRVSGVSFEPGTSGVALTGGAVSARLSSGKLALDSASAVVGGGRVFASGTAVIDSGGLEDVDLALKATGIKITKKNLYQLNVKTTDLRLKSAKERYLLTGLLDFGETRLVRDIEISDIVGMMQPETDVLEEPQKEEPLDLMTTVKNQVVEPDSPPGFLQKLEFDIEIRNAEGLWVDNNLAKFRTNHDLRLQGTFDEASLTGRIDVRDRGELIFLDRRFEILNGVIDCSDPRRLNPVINLTATCDVTESSSGTARPTRYTITLTVSGPLDEFDYALTSKPSLEQADIFSLLALGMTQYQLEAGGNKDAVYKDRSEVIASQQISNSVNRFFDNMLGDLLALDHIGIGGNLFDPSQARFEVTKRWSDRVEVKYSTSITNVDEQILSAEYKINDFLYLEGKTDQKEDSGADLKFRIWFK